MKQERKEILVNILQARVCSLCLFLEFEKMQQIKTFMKEAKAGP